MKQIRTSKFSKILAYYLAIMIFLQVAQPMQMYALTEGPSQPEFNSFTPIGTSDMVDLASGDFNYNIPIMDVGGYPINLAYNSGVTMDQEASWVGLGWNLNVGQINRQMRGLPDDFNGDPMIYENNMKDNVTVGANFGVHVAPFGFLEGTETPINGLMTSAGLGVKYNNYDGIGFSLTGGVSYQINDNLSVGMQMESSVTDGVSVSPDISYNAKLDKLKMKDSNLGLSAGVSYNSRKGIESMTFSPSIKKNITTSWQRGTKNDKNSFNNGFGSGTTLSYNPDVSFTPTKRVAMRSSNYMFNMNIEGAVYGIDGGIKFGGYRTSQGIDDSEKHKVEKGYGYENTYGATTNDILDFNREKDRTVNRNTTVLPITNYTYDIYSIQGQGISGMFRPYKGQINYVYDNFIQDKTNGGSLGVEFGIGAGHHWGFNASVTIANSKTKLWSSNNLALNRLKEDKNNNLDYEKIYFKNVGGSHVDNELSLLNDKLGKYNPIQFPVDGSKYGRNIKQRYVKKDGSEISYNGSIKRTKRVKRNQAIQKLTRKEAGKYGLSRQFSEYAKDHHTAEIQITKEGGDRYVFGRALYNVTKKEVTFDISGREGDCSTGLVSYLTGDNSANNERDGDRYFNRVTTPAYAHTYLLTTVLSSDYQDIDEIPGPSDSDLGSYTKFKYDKKDNNLYKWRVPFFENKANYDEGLKSSKKDDKANYQYGEKEQVFIKQIETKTHIAIFETSVRKDGYGVKNENGGLGSNSKSYKLDKIYLYSKPEYEALGSEAIPIKVAHFEYDYTLCKGIHNNENYANSSSQERGKLTLKKVYFTYRNSNMGKYTPYEFNYQNNFDYNMKAYDVWGNYKPTSDNVSCSPRSGDMSNAEFPFVDQMNRNPETKRNNADIYATAWHLNSVKLPSGGLIDVSYESDDYAYVQDKEVMQMFKVIGAGDANNNKSDRLFGSKYLYIKLDKPVGLQEFNDKYIKQLQSKPIYFRFLVNMSDPNPLPGANTTDKYDYVTGYLNLDNDIKIFDGGTTVAIKIKSVNKGDGLNAGSDVNPISKAGWNFGRAYLNRLVYGITNNEDANDLKSIVMELIATVPSVLQIFQSPNGRLQAKEIASKFVPNKSWIRLMQPDGEKFGGGSRVKEVKLHDNWNIMTDNPNYAEYSQFYGQQYSYDKDGKSSGVASYEPIGCKENPLVQPFYDKNNSGLLLGPDEQNYVEEPLGESFFPSPKITYSRVSVKNLPREKKVGNEKFVVKKQATGQVVTEFFTSKDYPTQVDYTTMSSKYDKSPLASILNINAKTHLTMSQGFVVHTNDMDGKMKSQRVYAEGQTAFISGIDYKYSDNLVNVKENGLLNNQIKTIDSEGNVKESIVGVDLDVINDFRLNESVTSTPGLRFNTAGLPLPFIYLIVPTPLPSYSRHENVLKTAVTTKVVHSMGILRETVAYDLGSVVSTKNLAWDAETGEVILTETVNEYNDNYYSFSYPAYWNEEYKAMGQAITNLNIESEIEHASGGIYKFKNGKIAKNYLLPGDELWITQDTENGFVDSSLDRPRPFKAWVVDVTDAGFVIIDKEGIRVDEFKVLNGTAKVIRSGYRNLQTASMASVTSMKNPLTNLISGKLQPNLFLSSAWDDYRIINASAIEYENVWPGQCECNLPEMKYENGKIVFNHPKIDYNSDEVEKIYRESFNPYLYNIKGNWRAKKSYAYLTGRHHSNNITPRVSGFFKQFHPFYVLGGTKWKKNTTDITEHKWTFASEVTQYNPFGQEVENKDALNRFSSALYGYNYRFPLAVASNTKYSELAFDGFEDYNFSNCEALAHFNFQGALDENNITLSNNYFHTGTKSIRVAPKNGTEASRKAVIKKKVVSCNDPSTATQRNKKAIRTNK
jgi:hypothetical protein